VGEAGGWKGRWGGEDRPRVVEAEEVWSGPPPSMSLGSTALQLLSPGKVGVCAPVAPLTGLAFPLPQLS
jgi:hypothetical protein